MCHQHMFKEQLMYRWTRLMLMLFKSVANMSTDQISVRSFIGCSIFSQMKSQFSIHRVFQIIFGNMSSQSTRFNNIDFRSLQGVSNLSLSLVNMSLSGDQQWQRRSHQETFCFTSVNRQMSKYLANVCFVLGYVQSVVLKVAYVLGR